MKYRATLTTLAATPFVAAALAVPSFVSTNAGHSQPTPSVTTKTVTPTVHCTPSAIPGMFPKCSTR